MTSPTTPEPGPPVPAAHALLYVVLDSDPLTMRGYEQYDVDLPKDTPAALIAAVERLSADFDGASCGLCGGHVGWGLYGDRDEYSRFTFTTLVVRPAPAKTDLRLCEECTMIVLDDVPVGQPDPPFQHVAVTG
jgi:hypothetical protein